MANFNLTITNEGAAFLADVIANQGSINFTEMRFSSTNYVGSEATLTEALWTGTFKTVTPSASVLDDQIINVTGSFDNTGFVSDRNLYSIGLIGSDGVNTALVAVATTSTPDVIIHFVLNASTYAYSMNITVSSTENITVSGSAANALFVSDIVDNLGSVAVNKPLSAKQGKVLNDLIQVNRVGSYLPLTDLGTAYTQELKDDIHSGEFKKAVVGGVLTINGHEYAFAHPNYWLHTGDVECTDNHMVVVLLNSNLVTGKLNNTDITTGGYLGSDFKTGNNGNTALADIRAIIQADFGAENILTHREYFTNAVSGGKPSGTIWADSDIDLMNEEMAYGCIIYGVANDGTIPSTTTIDKNQLKLFQERPDLLTTDDYWWLRDVASASRFSLYGNKGFAYAYGPSADCGIRPVFAIY